MRVESLESRLCLAGDYLPGDSNQDFYFDESDFVLTMKAAKFETEELADWTEGDWDDDGEFNSGDLVAAFVTGKYRRGPYNLAAVSPTNELQEIVRTAVPDVEIQYDSTNGSIRVTSFIGPLTTFHLSSQSGRFHVDGERLAGLFDARDEQSLFVFEPSSPFETIEWASALDVGLSIQELINDLRVDGSRHTGGGLGRVNLVVHPGPNPDLSFVGADQANGTFVYDAQTGDVTVIGNELMSTIELVSTAEIFIGTASRDYKIGVFDVATERKLFRLEPTGLQTYEWLEVATTGLTEQQLIDDLEISGTLVGGGPVQLALEYISAPDTNPNVAGQIFVDVDSNGAKDEGESGIDGLDIELLSKRTGESVGTSIGSSVDQDKNSIIDPNSEKGRFSFGSLPIGEYTVSIASPDWKLTSNSTVTVTKDQLEWKIALANRFAYRGRLPGDVNGDYYLDESDLIAVMKTGKFEKGFADWAEGDFNGDGIFDGHDLRLALQTRTYIGAGSPYGPLASDAVHERKGLDPAGDDAIVEVQYNALSGEFWVTTQQELSSFHMVSTSNRFIRSDKFNEFDTTSRTSVFRFEPRGIDFSDTYFVLGRTGQTESELLADLSFDGSFVGGGAVDSATVTIQVIGIIELRCQEILSFGTPIGDVNLDGVFDSTDLVLVFQAGEFEDHDEGNSTWFEGDWNCDGDFNTSDLVTAFQQIDFQIDRDRK